MRGRFQVAKVQARIIPPRTLAHHLHPPARAPTKVGHKPSSWCADACVCRGVGADRIRVRDDLAAARKPHAPLGARRKARWMATRVISLDLKGHRLPRIERLWEANELDCVTARERRLAKQIKAQVEALRVAMK